jgi:hypothetical protein
MTWIGEISCPYRDSNSEPPTAQPLANGYTDCDIPASIREGRKMEERKWKNRCLDG